MTTGKYIRTEETKKKMSLARQGRTWEQLYGKEKADELKEKSRKLMIGNKKTLGIYPTKETREKMSLIHKGIPKSEEHKRNIGLANTGKILSEETKNKISLAKTGKKLPPFTEEHKQNMSISRKGKSFTEKHKENLKESWKNEERRNKTVQASLKLKQITSSEQILFDIIKRNNLPFNYVGNGQVVFNGFCPDFLSKNPKYIIELFGVGHYCKNCRERDRRKLEVYSSLGYKTLIINTWSLNNEEKIVNKIKEFIK